MSAGIEQLRVKLWTVHDPPYLPLYLHDEDVELLGPELTHGSRPGTSLWERSVWIAPCDTDGFTWLAYRRQVSPDRRDMRRFMEGRLVTLKHVSQRDNRRWNKRELAAIARINQGLLPKMLRA